MLSPLFFYLFSKSFMSLVSYEYLKDICLGFSFLMCTLSCIILKHYRTKKIQLSLWILKMALKYSFLKAPAISMEVQTPAMMSMMIPEQKDFGRKIKWVWENGCGCRGQGWVLNWLLFAQTTMTRFTGLDCMLSICNCSKHISNACSDIFFSHFLPFHLEYYDSMSFRGEERRQDAVEDISL